LLVMLLGMRPSSQLLQQLYPPLWLRMAVAAWLLPQGVMHLHHLLLLALQVVGLRRVVSHGYQLQPRHWW
jgi:hypothetical protein